MLIDFLGKNFVETLYVDTDFCELLPDKKLSVLRRGEMPNVNGNVIVQGDNLQALKTLLPHFAGRVNCVYIDPPYNTGNEGWRYNDRVNSPLMRDWLRKTVDREDLSRHDKWCCMMYPRLIMMRELLAPDGVIFVSIDDNEQHRLRVLMDEIFGEGNFIATLVVRSNPGGRDYGGIAITHEYVVVYGASDDNELNQIEAGNGHLPLTDEWGAFDIRELRNRNIRFNKENRPNLYYPIYVNPQNADDNGLLEISLAKQKGWIEVYPLESNGVDTVWRWQASKVEAALNKDVKGKKKRDGGFQVVEKYRKTTRRERSILDDTGYRNEAGTLKLKELFGGSLPFDYPKSDMLIKQLIRLGCPAGGIVLDSFAGSGTTAQATLELNQEDGGNRQFILVECEDYADSVTAERVRRVIKGAPTAKSPALQAGLGGDFSFWRMSPPRELITMLDGDGLPAYDALAAFLFFKSTGEAWSGLPKNTKHNFIGATGKYEVYLHYRPDMKYLLETGLTLDMVEALPAKTQKTRLVFCPINYVEASDLQARHVKFCQLPYQIYGRAVEMAKAVKSPEAAQSKEV